MTADQDSSVMELVNAALQQDHDGERLFSDEDVVHFLPWVMVNMGVDASQLEEDALALFSNACQQAGVVAKDDAVAISKKVDAYYRQHPPNRHLVAAFEAAYREINQGAAMTESPFARLSGDKHTSGVLGGTGPRPAGTVAGGPLARFKAHVPK